MHEFSFAIFIAITTGLVEVVKRSLPKVRRFAPLLSLVFGVALALLVNFSVAGLLQGLIVGLSASGIYSGSKAMLKL